MIAAIPVRMRWSASVAVAFFCLIAADVAAVEFVPLGFLGRSQDSWASGISGDGRVVVGESRSEAFRWTAEDGIVGLAGLGGFFGTRANAASFNGAVVVGEANTPDGTVGFRWTESEGMVALSGSAGWAVDISADGTVIVGLSGEIWKQEEGPIPLPDPECCFDGIQPSAISADGSVVVGSAYITSTPSPYRWIDGVGADIFLQGQPNAYPSDTSADGSVIVGILDYGNDSADAFRWTDSDGLEVMPPPDNYNVPPLSAALAVSADGSIIAGHTGQYHTSEYWENLDAAVWDEVRGWRRIDEILTRGGIDPTGWHLSEATDISADGRVVVGYGINPDGNREAWMAVIPEPAALLLCVPLVAVAVCVVRHAGCVRR
jgi:uncharacterized membrane protein